jgi:hypothetical protein
MFGKKAIKEPTKEQPPMAKTEPAPQEQAQQDDPRYRLAIAQRLLKDLYSYMERPVYAVDREFCMSCLEEVAAHVMKLPTIEQMSAAIQAARDAAQNGEARAN